MVVPAEMETGPVAIRKFLSLLSPQLHFLGTVSETQKDNDYSGTTGKLLMLSVNVIDFCGFIPPSRDTVVDYRDIYL